MQVKSLSFATSAGTNNKDFVSCSLFCPVYFTSTSLARYSEENLLHFVFCQLELIEEHKIQVDNLCLAIYKTLLTADRKSLQSNNEVV